MNSAWWLLLYPIGCLVTTFVCGFAVGRGLLKNEDDAVGIVLLWPLYLLLTLLSLPWSVGKCLGEHRRERIASRESAMRELEEELKR